MATRRQAHSRSHRGQAVNVADIEIPSDDLPSQEVQHAADESGEIEVDEDDEGQDVEAEEVLFPPPGLKEISSLASWTVSTAKPGNGVAALRSPDTNLFWQSDGPQPHLLSIHFFKLVAIVHMRIFLDFGADESYTPTKIQFLAGMGVHDIQEFAEMSFEQPTGWIDVDFSNVGPVLDDDDDDDEDEEEEGPREIDWTKRPVLRAFLVQVKILENHQNGKDTHLRAVQLFARDEMQLQQTRRASSSAAAAAAAAAQQKLALARALPSRPKPKAALKEPNNIRLASWMMEPDLR